MREFDDLKSQSRPSGRTDREGREIRLLGAPILAWNPATNDSSLPEEHREHPMIRGRHFYTLPLDVLDTVVTEVGEERFDADSMAMERQLSNICGDHSCRIGFWQNAAIPYYELRSKEVEPYPEEEIRKNGLDPVRVHHAVRTYRERDVMTLERFSRGFCGWLLTNQQFLDEHDVLLANHADTVRRWGTHHAASFLSESFRSQMLPDTDPNKDPSWQKFVADCNPFLLRWRLVGLVGPYLPIPSKPLMAGSFPPAVIEQLTDAGGVFYIPDTMPIPSRDRLRSMLDHALRGHRSADHLNEWLDIVRSDNMARNRMDPFVRMLELQHYWRIFCQRHAASMSKTIGRFQLGLAAIFNVRPNQIKQDLSEIRNRLGNDWAVRDWPV